MDTIKNLYLIGSSHIAKESVREVKKAITTLNPKIIYGGSVNSQNAEEFLKHEEINGALVGGASLKSEEIIKIVEIAKKYSINIIGATHYSTEKWACMNMLDYFRKIGLGCVFMPGKPDMNDL